MAESSPYRFVPLSETVVPSPVQAPSHAVPCGDQKSGHIDVVWQASGPLLLGDRGSDSGGGPVRPFLLAPDSAPTGGAPDLANAAIPATSLRGMLRAVFEIVTFSKLSLLNERYRFGFRDFQDEDYAALLDRGAVKAGWLELDDDGSYHLRTAQWRQVSIDNLEELEPTINAGTAWKYRPLKSKYVSFKIYSSTETPRYRWQGQYAWSESALAVFKHHDPARPEDCQPCDLVFSGALPPPGGNAQGVPKLYEYVILAEPESCRRPLDPEIFNDFYRVHGKPMANGDIEPDGSWAELSGNLEETVPREHRRVPVFYVGDINDQTNASSRLRIGLTRLFKLAHRFAVGELRPASHLARQPLDMTEALFGYVDEPPDETRPTALRSRLAFGIARITPQSAQQCDLGAAVEAVLMTPRASFDPFYVTLLGRNRACKLSYSAAEDGQPAVRLAGRKRYPVRSAPASEEMAQIAASAAANVKSRLQFLERRDGKSIQFHSRIRFHNLHPVELGALVWTLRLGGYGYHAIGRAKPYGYGRLAVAGASQMVVNGAAPCNFADVADDLQQPFLTYMREQLGTELLVQTAIQRLILFAQPKKWGDRMAAAGFLSYPGAASTDGNTAKAYNAIKKRRRQLERQFDEADPLNRRALEHELRQPVLALDPPENP